MRKKLTLIKTYHGTSTRYSHKELMLRYSDNGVCPVYNVEKGYIDLDALERIVYAIKNGYELKTEGEWEEEEE